MAQRIQAFQAYSPRIKLQPRVDTELLTEFIARSTGLNESGVRHVLLELRDAIVFFNLQGSPVKLDGVGTFTPTVSLDGTFNVKHRPDVAIKARMNRAGAFKGTIEHEESLGRSPDELVERWNAEHPDDPVEP